MTIGAALRAAARDLYSQSWRLLAVNTTLSAVVLGLAAAAAFATPALVLLPLAGPFVAALAHAAVVAADGRDATVREAIRGLRLHARRGLVLGAAATLVAVLGEHALGFYASHHAWVPAALVVELLALFALHQLVAWTLAVAFPERGVRDASADAARVLLRRPLPALGLAFALLLIDGVAALAGVLPLLMLGGAFSFLAVAHLVLPEALGEEEAAWQV
jgi:hypothetical protein